MHLTPEDVETIRDYLEEVDSIIANDDEGELTPLPFVAKHDAVKELFQSYDY